MVRDKVLPAPRLRVINSSREERQLLILSLASSSILIIRSEGRTDSNVQYVLLIIIFTFIASIFSFSFKLIFSPVLPLLSDLGSDSRDEQPRYSGFSEHHSANTVSTGSTRRAFSSIVLLLQVGIMPYNVAHLRYIQQC